MKIFIGADHRGFILKEKMIRFLKKAGHEVADVGTYQKGKPCDYPKFSERVARSVVQGKNARGILVCMTGIGHAVAANKIPGIRAALCYNKKAAELSRTHNDANVLVVGARFTNQKDILGILKVWLKSKFEGGRHLRRVNQIRAIEKKYGQPYR